MVTVLFVCLGNICRSPMAEAIFRNKVKEAGLENKIAIDSAGTGDWHIGRSPHEGTLEILKKNKIDCGNMRARQIIKEDLKVYDYIIAMDAENLGNLHRLKGRDTSGEIRRLLDYIPESKVTDVPDPYFTGNFDEVFSLIDEACNELQTYIRRKSEL